MGRTRFRIESARSPVPPRGSRLAILGFAISSFLHLSSIGTAPCGAAGNGSETGALRFARPIEAEPATDEAWIEIRLDPEVRANASPDLSDLRVVDASGRVLPHRLREPNAMETSWTRTGTLDLDWKPNPGGGWVALLELRGTADRSILLVAEPDLRMEPREPNRARYPEMRPAGPGRSAFVLPGGDSDWTLHSRHDSRRPDPGAELLVEERRPRALEEVPFVVSDEDRGGSTWSGRIQLGGPARVVAAIEAELSAGRIERAEVAFEIGSAGWTEVPAVLRSATAPWSIRSGEDEAPRPSEPGIETPRLPGRIEWDPTARSQTLRLRLFGPVDAGGAAPRLRVLALPDLVEFQPSGDPPYRLLYGDPYLRAPTVLPTAPEHLVPARRPGRLGAVEPNPFRESPRGIEWLRRHPVVLSGALFAVLVLMGLLSLLGRRRPAA